LPGLRLVEFGITMEDGGIRARGEVRWE